MASPLAAGHNVSEPAPQRVPEHDGGNQEDSVKLTHASAQYTAGQKAQQQQQDRPESGQPASSCQVVKWRLLVGVHERAYTKAAAEREHRDLGEHVEKRIEIRPKATEAATQSEPELDRSLLVNIVIVQRPAVFQLPSGEDQPLLVRWDPLLVLDPGFDGIDRVAAVDLQDDRLTSQILDEDLHFGTLVCLDRWKNTSPPDCNASVERAT